MVRFHSGSYKIALLPRRAFLYDLPVNGIEGHKEIAGGNFDCPGCERPQRTAIPFNGFRSTFLLYLTQIPALDFFTHVCYTFRHT